MQTIKNIFPLIYDFENLFSAYKKAISCKRYRPDVMEYTDRLEENLIELQNTIIEFQGDIISILMALYIRAPNFYIPDELQSIISRNNALHNLADPAVGRVCR